MNRYSWHIPHQVGAEKDNLLHVVNCSFAITSKRQAVSHIPSTVFAKIKGVLSLMRMLWIAVRNHHLCQGQSVKDRSLSPLVVVRDVIENDALLVVESDMNFELLPLNDSALNLKRDAFWLSDVDRLDVGSISTLSLNGCSMVIVWLCFAERSANFWNIDMDDFLLVGIEDRAKVEWERVLAVIHVWSIVHQSLL